MTVGTAGIESLRVDDAWVDSDSCVCCELCVLDLPEVFEMPDDGGAFVKPEASALYVERAEDIVRVAEEVCPVDVIHVRIAGQR